MFLIVAGVNPACSSLLLPLSVQIINFREPVTLDFLDAELEDGNKEEVKKISRPNCIFSQGFFVVI